MLGNQVWATFTFLLSPVNQPIVLQKVYTRLLKLVCHARRYVSQHTHTHTHTHPFDGPFSGWASTRKVKPIWISLKQETVSGSGISWTICKSAPSSRQITTPVPYHSVFTGRMPFLPPNQQRQSTEGTCQSAVRRLSTDGLVDLFVLFTVFFLCCRQCQYHN